MDNDVLMRWETPCSDATRLYFKSLVDDLKISRLVFTVADERFLYEFTFEHSALGPYQVVDEAFLNYKPVNNPPGCTFFIANSTWHLKFNPGTLATFFPNALTHYGICADDSCLEILATSPPAIVVRQIFIDESATYDIHHYPVVIRWSEVDNAFVAEVPDLPGCMADGPTQREALANALVIIQEWLDFARELGREIPAPRAHLQVAA